MSVIKQIPSTNKQSAYLSRNTSGKLVSKPDLTSRSNFGKPYSLVKNTSTSSISVTENQEYKPNNIISSQQWANIDNPIQVKRLRSKLDKIFLSYKLGAPEFIQDDGISVNGAVNTKGKPVMNHKQSMDNHDIKTTRNKPLASDGFSSEGKQFISDQKPKVVLNLLPKSNHDSSMTGPGSRVASGRQPGGAGSSPISIMKPTQRNSIYRMPSQQSSSIGLPALPSSPFSPKPQAPINNSFFAFQSALSPSLMRFEASFESAVARKDVNRAVQLKLGLNTRSVQVLQAEEMRRSDQAVVILMDGYTKTKKAERVTGRRMKVIEGTDSDTIQLKLFQKERDAKTKVQSKTFNQASCTRIKGSWFPDARWRYGVTPRITSNGETQDILVYGGLGTQTYSGLCSFSPASQSWTQMPLKYQLSLPKLQGCRMVTIPPGNGPLSGWVVLFGGAGEKAGQFTNQIWGISPGESPTFMSLVATNAIPLPTPRREHAMFFYKGTVFVVGGQAEDGKHLKDVWKFDLATKSWRETMWKSAEKFDPLGYGLAQHQCSVLPRGISDGALVFGGLDGNNAANNDLWLLKSEGIWAKCKLIHPLGNKPAPRYAHCQTVLEEYGLLALYGGFSQDQKLVFRDLFIFVMESLTWSRIRIPDEALLPALAGAGLASSGSDIFLFGGLGSTGYKPFWVHKFSLAREAVHLRPSAPTDICKRFVQNLKHAVMASKGVAVPGVKRAKGILELIMEQRGTAIRKDASGPRIKKRVQIGSEYLAPTYFEYN